MEKYLYKVETAAEFPLYETLLQLLEEMRGLEEEKLDFEREEEEGKEEESREEELNEDRSTRLTWMDRMTLSPDNDEEEAGGVEKRAAHDEVDAQPREEEETQDPASRGVIEAEMRPDNEPAGDARRKEKKEDEELTTFEELIEEKHRLHEQSGDQQSGDQQ